MKRYLMPLVVITAAAFMAAACSSPSAKISGQFAGSNSETVKLSILHADGSGIADSTKTDSKGNFSFRIDLGDGHERIVNLLFRNSFITLLVAPGDKIKVNALACNLPNYKVTGSEESKLIQEINSLIFAGLYRLDSLSQKQTYYSSESEESKNVLLEYIRALRSVKREQLKFIENNSKSLAAVYALYQKLPNEQHFINSEIEMRYARLLADSLKTTYPDSPYLKALQNHIGTADNNENLMNMIRESLDNPISFPDLKLRDMYGNDHSLSELTGKVILIDFWAANLPQSAANNAELRELYNRFADNVFAVYQINLDKEKADWINALQKQNLPWISVRDENGMYSESAGKYNVVSLPANYIIGGDGEVAAKNKFGDELAKIIEREVNKLP